jgi:hypothetical protein
MPLRNMQWHPSSKPFIDIVCTPYNNGTVNIVMKRYDAQPGDTNDDARNRVAHVLFEDDIDDDERVIARHVRILHNMCAFMSTCKRQPAQQLALPRTWTLAPSKRRR